MANALREPYRCTLARIVATVDVPFGYALTIWSAGALAIDRFGQPNLGEIFAFLIGGIAGYLAIALVMVPFTPTIARAPSRRTSLINVVAIVAAIAVSGITRLAVYPLLGFFVASATGTIAYITVLAAFNWLTGH